MTAQQARTILAAQPDHSVAEVLAAVQFNLDAIEDRVLEAFRSKLEKANFKLTRVVS